LRREIALAARSDAKVLITGETGVGKEVVAHLVHEQSRRSTAPFITINCAGVPETLLESEFFGHARGSFTDAYRDNPGLLRQAHHGTVFLDEVGEMTPRMQGLLLRFLETGEVQAIGGRTDVIDVRVIAATNRDLAARSETGEFRLDLYYRLNVVRIDVPPLRERRDDIPQLVEHFLDRCAHEHQVAVPTLSPDVTRVLQAYDWPGNVRQLRNIVERLVVCADSAPVSFQDLPAELTHGAVAVPVPGASEVRPASSVDALWRRLVVDHEPFWSCVYPLFKAHEITCEDVRALIAAGLRETRGYYRGLIGLFNMPGSDYKRFMNFLDSAACKLPPQRYRTGNADQPIRRASSHPSVTPARPALWR
jgi:transcriptional regulator with PAS, ATPase and Fis domain